VAKTLKPAVKQISRFKEIEHPSIYSNFMGVTASPFDISIIFGEVEQATAAEVVGIPRVKVTIAPEQAANLIQMLSSLLQKYVEGNGALRQSSKVTAEAMAEMLTPSKVN
jgi:hypothetical protein